MNESDKVFHLGINKHDLKGATLAVLPGDPDRVEKIVQNLTSAVQLARHREFNVYLAYLDGKPIVVCSTGIGGPSTSIAVEELAQLGVKTFLRVGTTGAIQPEINVGDVIVTTGSVRLDGASQHFAPLEFPAVADFEAASALTQAAKAKNLPVWTGVTASSDTFYPGQERYDTYSGRVTQHFQGSLKMWQDMGVLNFEMESATLFTMCSSMGLRAGCIAGVIINRTLKEIPDTAIVADTERKTIEAVLEAANHLLA